ncbi:SPW repeat domain-containing protein [Spelaeicoccus albus]|uniref:SPW repeat-containing integral membrane domain-containing protein n=1 Tax=Spelaeicoccus albus TaxID=1280376 RepID=A0A7Z0D3I1_9MICO|nr:SPW repeat protein [Spelaeicoccus albus]NYI68201.1 hypothetical protein [Spelaeicoccus albus]
MKTWNRWQDWVTLAVGVVAAAVALFGLAGTAGTSSLVALGTLLIIAALISLAMPGLVVMEYVKVALGLLLIISPWVAGFSGAQTMATVAWAGGLIALAASLWAAPLSVDAHHHMHHPSGA